MPDLPPLSLLAPPLLLVAALVLAARPGRRPPAVGWLPQGAALVALALVAAGLCQVLLSGPRQASVGFDLLMLTFSLDHVSASMTLLVGFIGWVVMRYARSYLDGEAREGRFHALMLSVLAGVLVLMQAGSLAVFVLAFMAIGAGLRRLLLFYPERAAARRAATKFALVWHAADLILLLAWLLIAATFGTDDLASLSRQASAAPLPLSGHVAVALLVLAAALKTASFPLHGWLTEVMEAPTPVSALLHAGIINAGGYLLVRTADLVQASPGAMAALVMIGGLTALFGAVVMLTQSAIKTALAWSTVAQMGFMLLQCGLGLWALALLHIIAHSLYKAHAFLSSGNAVKEVANIRRPGPVAVPSVAAVLKSFALALAIFAAIAAAFTAALGPKSPQALALGAILIFGVAYLVAQGLADRAPVALTKRTAASALAAAVGYFSFQAIARKVWGPILPAAPMPGELEWALIVLAVASFGLVAFAQALFPLWAHHPATAGLRVHLANGLYLNALLDRAIGGFRTTAPR